MQKPIAVVLMILTLSSGCALMPQKSAVTLRIPAAPELSAHPLVDDCRLEGEKAKCVTLLNDDWKAVGAYVGKLTLELEAMCIKIGQVKLPSGWQTDTATMNLARREIRERCWAK